MCLRKEGYWDEHYKEELRNFEENGDEGEIWFGARLSKAISKWIQQDLNAKAAQQNKVSIIDLGCGNSYLLCTLRKDFPQESKLELNLLGIDYSANSIELSKKVVQSYALQEAIKLRQCNFLDLEQVMDVTKRQKYDYIIDKGTFDAICLLASESGSTQLEETKTKYLRSIYSLAKAASVFILASCNHTRGELIELLDLDCTSKLSSAMVDTIETPTIQFGGKQGSQVTCLIFKFD